MTLVKAITKAFKRQIILLLLVALIYVAAIMYSPILMNNMMDYINSKNKAVSQSVLFFFAIFMTNFILSVSSSHIFFRFAIFGYNLSNTLSLLLFNKALKHPLLTEKEYSTSDIVNYSQVDAQRMTYMGFQLTAIIFCPIQIVIGLLLLYIYIGISFLVGTGVMIIMMLLAFIFSKIFSKANDKLLKAKDKRMKVTEEIL